MLSFLAECVFFFFQAEDGIRDADVTGVQTCALPISKSLGLTPWQSIVRIHLPLLRPSLISAALLVFVDTLKELPATLVLRPFNFNTLAVKSFELANDEQLANAAPSVITIVLIGLIPVILLNFYMQRSQN